MLNWDPGNAATFADNTPYPNGYDLLPKHRIGHCHCKDVKRKPDGKYEWAPVGDGVVDWWANSAHCRKMVTATLSALKHTGVERAHPKPPQGSACRE